MDITLNGLDYVERNGLIPLSASTEPSFCQAGVDVAALCQQIREVGMRPEHFYYDPANPQAPYTYYRGAVRLDFQSLAGKMDQVQAVIQRSEQEISATAARRDFDRLLGLVDPRLAPELFMEAFNFIPDRDKYRLFECLWRFNPHAHDIFTDDFARQAYQFRGVANDLPPVDGDGYARIYFSPATGAEPGEAETWTANVNRALLEACSLPARPVYQGRVHLDGVVSYDSRWSVKEVKVKPGKVTDIQRMDLLDLAQFSSEWTAAGIMKSYQQGARRIKRPWFHQPEGLHAVGHTRRVLMLSLLLAYLEGYQPSDWELLALAAVFHDIGRDSDGYDPGHGQASYARTQDEGLLRWTDTGEREIFRFIVENHDLPDNKAYQRVDRYELGDMQRTLRLYQAFKDADGLDRVRLGDLNPDYLRTGSAPRLLLAAHQLYCQPQLLDQK